MCGTFRAQASNVGIGSGGYEGWDEKDNQRSFVDGPTTSDSSSEMWVILYQTVFDNEVGAYIGNIPWIFVVRYVKYSEPKGY